ncbi:MAG: ion transporter [Gammaproteobacteria bacterium]
MMSLKERCFEIKQSKQFQLFVSIVIIYSSLVIGFNTYQKESYLNLFFQYSDYLITIVFLIEILIRYTAEKSAKDFFSDGWNVFDSIIVAASLIPSGVSESVLVLRLLRLLRLLRIISFVPELRMVVENLIKALKKSIYILILIFLITYIYGVTGTQFFSSIEGAKFNTLGQSLITLTQVATVSGWEDVMAPVLVVYPLSWIYFISYIFIIAIVILNLFIAILVEVVSRNSIPKNDI